MPSSLTSSWASVRALAPPRPARFLVRLERSMHGRCRQPRLGLRAAFATSIGMLAAYRVESRMGALSPFLLAKAARDLVALQPALPESGWLRRGALQALSGDAESSRRRGR